MNHALNALFDGGPPTPEAIETFIADQSFPLVEPGRVIFVYRGEADEVILRRWISGFDTALPMNRGEGSDLWMLAMDLPDRSRFEYKFEVVRNGHRELLLDPLNPVTAQDPFGANSVCQGFGYERPEWTWPDPGAPEGSLDRMRVNSRAFDSRREAQVYLPARFRPSRRYPLLVVHDGLDYLRYAELKTVLDNLIHRLEIPALIAVLTQSPDRLVEYTGDERHARFLVEELIPAAARKYPLIDDRQHRGLMGASLGGVATLHAASLYPETFGSLLLQSGSFAFSDLGHHKRDPVFDPVVRFVNSYRRQPFRLADKIHVSCGIFESLIYENRTIVPLLQAQGMQVKFEEARDAHNWENWRDRLRSALTWLYPGPLWMVYE